MREVTKDNPEDPRKHAKRPALVTWFLFSVLVLLPSIVWAVVIIGVAIHRFQYFENWISAPILGIPIALLPMAVSVVAIRKNRIPELTALPVFGFLALIILSEINTTSMRVSSPDSQHEIMIRHPIINANFDSVGLILRLCGSGVCEDVYDLNKEIPSVDFHLSFAQVAWCDSPQSVAILASGTMELKLAFRLPDRSPIPFRVVQKCMEEAIRAEYDLTDEMLTWRGKYLGPLFLASTDGHRAFRRKYPNYLRIWTSAYRR